MHMENINKNKTRAKEERKRVRMIKTNIGWQEDKQTDRQQDYLYIFNCMYMHLTYVLYITLFYNSKV